MGKVTVPFVGMIIAECIQVALIILSKQVMSQGMTSFIFIFYSNTIAALVLLPSSFFIHRYLFSLLIIMNSIGLYKFQPFFLLQISTSSNHFFHSFWILHSWTTWVCFIIDANTRRIIMFIYVFSFFSVIWRRFSDMLGLTTAHQHLPLQCLILFLVLPSSLLFFSGSFSALILTISNAGDE